MKKLRSVITYFDKSTQANEKLLEYQRQSMIPEYAEQKQPKKLLQDVVTRWWSSYRSLKRARFLRRAINGLLAAEEVECEVILPHEWKILEQIELALKPMADFQLTLEGEKYVTSSLVPVAVYQIRQTYQSIVDGPETDEEVRKLVKILLADFDTRYEFNA